jgi:cell division septation protein DedD
MLANAVYFGWQFMEGGQVTRQPLQISASQQGKPIQLLTERPVAAQPAVEQKEEEAPSEEPQKETATTRECFSVGAFASEGSAQRWAEQMRAKGFGVRSDKRKSEVKDYWVFVPAFTNRAKAEERLKELKRQQVDGFIVKDGSFINAISLNHFSKKDLADAYLKKMDELGIQAETREVIQPKIENWLYLTPSAAKNDLRASIDAFLTKQTDLRRENSACTE